MNWLALITPMGTFLKTLGKSPLFWLFVAGVISGFFLDRTIFAPSIGEKDTTAVAHITPQPSSHGTAEATIIPNNTNGSAVDAAAQEITIIEEDTSVTNRLRADRDRYREVAIVLSQDREKIFDADGDTLTVRFKPMQHYPNGLFSYALQRKPIESTDYYITEEVETLPSTFDFVSSGTFIGDWKKLLPPYATGGLGFRIRSTSLDVTLLPAGLMYDPREERVHFTASINFTWAIFK